MEKLSNNRVKLLIIIITAIIYTIVALVSMCFSGIDMYSLDGMNILKIFLVFLVFSILLLGNKRAEQYIEKDLKKLNKPQEVEIIIEYVSPEPTEEEFMKIVDKVGIEIAEALNLKKKLTPVQIKKICEILDKYQL